MSNTENTDYGSTRSVFNGSKTAIYLKRKRNDETFSGGVYKIYLYNNNGTPYFRVYTSDTAYTDHVIPYSIHIDEAYQDAIDYVDSVITTHYPVSDATFELMDNVDNTKKIKFDVSSIAPATTRTITIPDSSDIMVLASETQFLRYKSLDSTCLICPFNDDTKGARLSTDAYVGGTVKTITIPEVDGTMTLNDATQTLSNKTLTTPTIASIKPSALYTHTVPDIASDTFTLNAAAQTLTNKTLTTPVITSINSGFGTHTIPDAASDTFTMNNVNQTLANKTLTTPIIASIKPSVSNTHTVPDFPSDTFTLNNTAQTLTNKTLTTPTIAAILNSGTITLPTGTRTLVARDTTDTLTNKALSDSTCTIQNNSDTSKKIQFQISPVTPATTRTYDAYDASGVLGIVQTATTYTATLGGSSGTNFTISQTSQYFKINDVYFINVRVQWTNKNTAAGELRLSMPITITADRVALSIAYFTGGTWTSGYNIFCGGNVSTSYVTFRLTNPTAGTSANLQVSACSASGEINVSGIIR